MRTDVSEAAYKLYRGKLKEAGREAAVERMAIVFCGQPSLWPEMGWPDVADISAQVPLGASRADVVLKHVDGSITLIEVKPSGLSLREYCTGIGQLAYQAIMAISAYQTFNVRRVLCLPGPVPHDLVLATMGLKIDLLPLPTVEQWDLSCASLSQFKA